MEHRPTTGTRHRPRYIFIAAPDGAAGGGMGRVKDYLLRAAPDGNGRYELRALVTRDTRGAAFSALLLARGMARMAGARARGRAALLHVNMGDRLSAVRKGLLVLFARMIGIPALLHLHAVELEAHYAQGGPMRRWFIRQPFRAASTIVVLGERYRAWLANDLGIDNDRIDILNNGVDTDPALPSRQPDRGRPLQILFLGNLIERNGISDFLEALALLSREETGWRAVIAGAGERQLYADKARDLGLGDRVDLVGWVDQTRAQDLVRQSDMLVLPSYDEGLPLVILEALGAGLPVICTPVGSIPETLCDGETALFCQPGDRAGLAARMRTLMRDADGRARLSVNGRAVFDRLFSLGAFRRNLFAIYRKRCGIDYQPDTNDREAERNGLP
jgi:glycosyltransferase involved in cell wall biosynthesis